jgi:hypothetical protein
VDLGHGGAQGGRGASVKAELKVRDALDQKGGQDCLCIRKYISDVQTSNMILFLQFLSSWLCL